MLRFWDQLGVRVGCMVLTEDLIPKLIKSRVICALRQLPGYIAVEKARCLSEMYLPTTDQASVSPHGRARHKKP